jgi:hypothetical protein
LLSTSSVLTVLITAISQVLAEPTGRRSAARFSRVDRPLLLRKHKIFIRVGRFCLGAWGDDGERRGGARREMRRVGSGARVSEDVEPVATGDVRKRAECAGVR